MNRKLIIACIILVLVQIGTIIYTIYSTSGPDLVYVDSVRLLNGYKGMQAARKEYQKKYQKWQANIDTLTNNVQKMILEHEKEVASMTAKERVLSEKLIQGKQKELINYQEAIRAQANEADNKMTNAVLVEVNSFIANYGQGEGYRIILAATASGNIVYAEEELDITDRVIIALNKNYVGS